MKIRREVSSQENEFEGFIVSIPSQKKTNILG